MSQSSPTSRSYNLPVTEDERMEVAKGVEFATEIFSQERSIAGCFKENAAGCLGRAGEVDSYEMHKKPVSRVG